MKINELLMNIHRKDFNIEKELQVKKYLQLRQAPPRQRHHAGSLQPRQRGCTVQCQ